MKMLKKIVKLIKSKKLKNMIDQSRLRFSKPVKSVEKNKYMKKIMKTHLKKILM